MAGCAYVPLDPAQPASRLAYILADTGVSILVCTRGLRSLAETLAGNERTIIELEAMTATPLPNLPVTAPGSIAYVLYTSGSTGRPKGVIQSHRNVLHFMREYTENLALTADDRLIQVASYAFDAGVMDIFGALLNGATLYPVNLRSTSPEDACAWLAQEEISILHVTPTVFRVLIAALTIPLPKVRLVVLGGEAALGSDDELARGIVLRGALERRKTGAEREIGAERKLLSRPGPDGGESVSRHLDRVASRAAFPEHGQPAVTHGPGPARYLAEPWHAAHRCAAPSRLLERSRGQQ